MTDLSAYIPRDRLCALTGGESLPDRASGAVLFADVSGFTPLTRTFADALGHKRGAEALLNVLNPLFETLIEPVHRYGGSVIGFAGDAITCWFDDLTSQPPFLTDPVENAALRAVAAALAMQAGLAQFAAVPTPAGVEVSLNVKAGIAAGPVRRFLVGDPAIQRIEVLAGETLVRMAAAETHARQGEIIVSREVAVSLGDALHVSAWRSAAQVAVVGGLAVAVEPTPWPTLPLEALPVELFRQWMLPALYEQLHKGAGDLGDLRPVTPLMLRFGGIDFDADGDAGVKLDAFVCWVQRIVHYHGGILLQLTTGDKGAFIYAPFGAPQAHENDPQRAMQAALALRALPPELAAYIHPLQIGLTRGEVWTGNCGGHGRFTYGVMGSEVNLAARLMSQARPGQILVSGPMSEYPGFRLHHVGDLIVKGFEQPVPTYSLLGELSAEEPVFSTPMVGREAELQQLMDFAQPLSAGKLAGTAVIYGEPGIGKSRLAYALRQQLNQTGVSWFSGQTDQILRQALNPFVYWLKSYFHQSPDDTPVQNKAHFTNHFNELISNLQSLATAPQSLIGELIRTQSFLGALLGLHWDGSLYEQLDNPKLRHQNTLTAIRTLILAESRLQPVVVELKDGHWLDESSRDLLMTLSRNVAAYPLLIVITSRYHDDGTKPTYALDEDMPMLTLDLDVLSREALGEQAVAILGGPLAPELLTLLWERSHANPFFVEQMLLHFRETGALGQTAVGDWGLKAIPGELPADVNAMLIARMDRLAQQVKQVVQVAAVLGREFDVQLLANMLRADVLPEVQRAESEQIWSLLHELRYIFKHALLRDAAYEMQLSARLRDLHYLAAATTEQVYADQLPNYYDMLAYHYHLAYQLGAETAVAKTRYYLRRAGEAAQENFANDAALAYYQQLLSLLKAGDQIEIHLKVGAVWELIGKWDEAETHYHTALTFANANAALQAEAKFALGKICRMRGDYVQALQWLEQAQAEWQALPDPAGVSRALMDISHILCQQGNYAEAQTLSEESLIIQRTLGDKQGLAQALKALGIVLYSRGDYAGTRALFEEGLAIGRELGDKQVITTLLNQLGVATYSQNEYGLSRALLEENLRLGRELGDKLGLSKSFVNLGLVMQSLGDYAKARAFFEESVTLKRELGDKWGLALALSNLGMSVLGENDYASAHALHHESLTLRLAIGNRPFIPYNLVGLANVALGQGELKRATALAAAAITLLEADGRLMEPVFREPYERTLTAVQAQLDEAEFNAAWTEGSKWSLEEAVELALKEPS